MLTVVIALGGPAQLESRRSDRERCCLNHECTAMPDSALSEQMLPSRPMTDKQFLEFCQVNRDLRIERDRLGVISIVSSSETGLIQMVQA